jgi:hypothetical protein
MPSRVRSLLIFLILLIPSAQYAWRDRSMPQFAYLHDDGLFFISAQSLAVTGSYRIPSLVENPAQTKFPPLFPAYLSLIWKLNPVFPDNLHLATWFCWAVFAIFLGMVWILFRRYGFSLARTVLLVGLLGVSPYLILFGCSMFSEIFFTCWVLATFLALSFLARPQVGPTNGAGLVLLAGFLAGCAYLSRTTGIALLVSVPAWMIWKKQGRHAALFAAAMLPEVIGWTLWTRTHISHSSDQTLMYYTDYIRYQFLNVGFDNLPVVLWKNLDQVLYGMGSLVLPKIVDMLPVKILTQVIAIAMITGTVRLARRGIAVDYALFSLISVGILLVWHFPPNERFVLPLYPLLLAGLVAEIEHIAVMLKAAFRHRDFGQRAVAALMSLCVASVFGCALILQLYMSFVFLHESNQQKTAKLSDLRAAYSWISANLPPSAAILSYDDPLLYLYTSHRGNYLPLLPRWWYAENHAAILDAYRNLPAYCRSRGLDYVYFTSEDLSRETGDEDRLAVQRIVRGNPELTPIFQAGIGTVYRIAPAGQ